MGNISEDFSFSEFERSGTAERLGIRNVISTVEVRDAIVSLVREVLQPLRDAVGRPLHVNSGYRCAELNRAVGGVAASQHVRGEACDIRCDTSKGDLSPYALASKIVELGLPYDQLVVYDNFLHISHKPSDKQRCQIVYAQNYNGRKISKT